MFVRKTLVLLKKHKKRTSTLRNFEMQQHHLKFVTCIVKHPVFYREQILVNILKKFKKTNLLFPLFIKKIQFFFIIWYANLFWKHSVYGSVYKLLYGHFYLIYRYGKNFSGIYFHRAQRLPTRSETEVYCFSENSMKPINIEKNQSIALHSLHYMGRRFQTNHNRRRLMQIRRVLLG